MRSSKQRSRGNKNRNNRPTGGNIINRVFDSSGPDGKVRGTPQQIIEKYNQLHRDAQLSNDRIAAENFAQHAEHYTRMLAEAMREVEKAREEQDQWNRDRQSERDRERQARFRTQEEGGADAAPADPALADQPEFAGYDQPYFAPEADQGPGLVDTPEGTTPVAERPREPRAEGRGDNRPERNGERNAERNGERNGERNAERNRDARPERRDRDRNRDRREDRPAAAPAPAPAPVADEPALPAFLTSVTFAPEAPPVAAAEATDAPRPRRRRKPKETGEGAPDPAEVAE
jgi:hypothetical protein